MVDTASEIRSHIDSESKERSHWKAWSLFLWVFGWYVATLVGAVFSAQLSVYSIWPLKFLCVFFNGISIAILFIIGHDGCHRCYSPSRMADGFIGRVALLPCLWSFSCWRVTHNYFHHGYTNIKGKDKDSSWQPMSLEDYQNASWFDRAVERHMRTWLGIATHWFYAIWCLRCVVPREYDWKLLNKRKFEFIWEHSLLVAYFVAEVAFVVYFGAHEFAMFGPLAPVAAVVLYLAIPFWIYCFFTGLVTLLQHTHPTTVWFANQKEWTFFDSQIDGTVHFRFRPFYSKFFINVMEHNAHHVDTLIPVYNLVRPQLSLEEAYPDNIVVEDFSFATVSRILKTCKLYDFENHCWLDFEGNRTTPSIKLVEKRAANDAKPAAMPASHRVDAPETHEPSASKFKTERDVV